MQVYEQYVKSVVQQWQFIIYLLSARTMKYKEKHWKKNEGTNNFYLKNVLREYAPVTEIIEFLVKI